MQRPREMNLKGISLPHVPRCGPVEIATRGPRTQGIEPSVERYLVETALAFARTCATTFGTRAARVSARLADVTHSTNSLRCENENASNSERSFAAKSARA